MKTVIPILCFSLIFLTISCAINPVTGKRELSLISEKEEIALGKQTDEEIKAQYGIYSDQALNAYVQRVGQSMTPLTHRPHLNYHFAVLDTPVVNAFAVPGGYVYVTRGILALMNSEAELAVVLGHELGHVNARHSVAKLSQLMLAQFGLAVGGAISETFAKITGAASIGIQLLFLKFSRDDEREADALGVEYSRKGGYNPGEMVVFFASLEKMGDLSGGQSLPGFLSTHPLTNERILNTKDMLLESDRQLKIETNGYLAAVNNMVYGQDPRQGYVEKNAFYHPQLRFFFSFPGDWQVQNMPSQVTLATKDGNAGIILQAEKTSENLKDYANKVAAKIENGEFIDERSFRINGLTSYHQVYDITQESGGKIRTRLSYIKKGGFIYTFIALSAQDDFSRYDRQFQSVVGSFQELRETRYLNRKPQRIQLIKANGRDSLQTIFQKSGIAKDLWPKFAIMNSGELDFIPKSGQTVKLVR
ncbi:MAG: M48 family metalloprotease [Candidatus Aminicenantes bacterium]|nr:MAG: M48 family metalloprotease [Candidatus Aminicenantes bacterium]